LENCSLLSFELSSVHLLKTVLLAGSFLAKFDGTVFFVVVQIFILRLTVTVLEILEFLFDFLVAGIVHDLILSTLVRVVAVVTSVLFGIVVI
jgi:hypothetical protein